MNCGIYQISAPSGGCYIGSAKNFERRFVQHKSLLRLGKHHSPALQNAYYKYGVSPGSMSGIVNRKIWISQNG